MTKANQTKTNLRQQAEAKLSKRKKSPVMDANQRLIYELQVHQIELEMQNEELVQARAEAEAVHRQYVDLYDFAPLGYFTLTRDGTIQRSNLTGARLLGAERSKLAKHRFGVFVSIESRPAFNAFLEKIFTTENNESCEIMLLKEGHASFWVHLDAVCSEDRLECRVVMKDITERKQSESALFASQNLYRLLAENSSDVISMIDAEDKAVYISPAYTRQLGYEEHELLNIDTPTILQQIHPDDRAHIGAEIKRGREIKLPTSSYQYRTKTKQGGYIWVEDILRRQFDENGNFVRTIVNSRDITQRKLAEEALAESEKKFRALFETMSDGIVYEDHDGKIISANPAAERLLGLSFEQMQGRTSVDPRWKAIHADGSPFPGETHSLHVAATTGKPASDEVMGIYNPKLNAYIWLSVNSTPEFLPGEKKPFRAFAVFRDITERRQAEEALQKSEARYAFIANNTTDVIWTLSLRTGKYTYVSPSVQNLRGYTPDEVMNQTMAESLTPESLQKATALIQKRLASRKPGDTSSYTSITLADQLCKDGSVVSTEAVGTMVFDENGAPLEIVGVSRDITERKQIEDTLMFLLQSGYQDEDFFHSLARYLTSSLSMDYVCIDRLAGDQLSAQTLAVYFDGKFDDNVSYTLKDTPCGDVVGKAVCIFPSQVRHLFPLDAVLQEMPAESYVGCTLWSSQGTPIGLIAVIGRNPLSAASQRTAESILKLVAVRAAGELERLQAEEEIRQLNVNLEQRVEERTRELRDAQEKLVRQGKLTVMGELAGSVGHELRNPLSVINSAVYYLKMVQTDATDEMKQYLDMIGQEVWNAEKIIDNLLDFGRAISADLEVVPVSELVDQTLEKIAPLESVKVTLDIPTGLPKVYVDPRQMRQVFGNLIVNACQAMTATSGAGGKLTISAVLQGGMVRVDICDNGIGIPSENLHKIFDPLFTTKAKGIGLGLALSKKLIEANHARIEVESEAGKGSTFIVYLPVYEK